MKRGIMKFRFLMIGMVFLLAFASVPALAADKLKLPDYMHWSCYDVGSGGYIQASAIADGILKKFNARVRLIPSGTSIGRLFPLVAGRVSVGWLATEVAFATEGDYDFASYEWGPQDLRVVLAHPTTHALYVAGDSGIKNVSDLKGKRVAWVVGNPSLNVKVTAYLAFADLTWKDVQKVEFPSFGATIKGLLSGQVDAASGTVLGGVVRLANSPKGVTYLPFPAADKAGWARMLKVAPFLTPVKETQGHGIDPKKPVELIRYRYPIATVRADASEDFVYNLIKAIDQSFPLYEKAHIAMPWWNIKYAGVPPADAPFHKGAIKYLKEKGIWTDEYQAWNDKLVERLKKVQALWKEFLPKAQAKNIKGSKLQSYWMAEKRKAFGE